MGAADPSSPVGRFRDRRGVRGLIAILVIGGIVFPLTGLTLAVLLLLDQFVIRVQARRRDRRAPA